MDDAENNTNYSHILPGSLPIFNYTPNHCNHQRTLVNLGHVDFHSGDPLAYDFPPVVCMKTMDALARSDCHALVKLY